MNDDSPLDATSPSGPVVLRVTRSAVVDGWRVRDRALRRDGVRLELVSAARWNEGGSRVELDPGDDEFIVAARTWGSHPNLFVYDPRPIWRALRGTPVEIVDAHEEPCSLAAAELRILRRLARPSAVLVLYSAQNIFKRYPWPFRLLEQMALRAAKGIYVCNEEAARILRRKGFRGRLALLPLGVDLRTFSPATQVAREGRPVELRLGYIGRLEHRKGVHVILEAMRGEPQLSLDVVGTGEAEPTLRRTADELELTRRVRFHGHVSHSRLPDMYRSLDVVVVPSLPTPDWEEQFCRVAVEAMASGIPVVASASGALPEVLGDAGLLFRPGDSESLRICLRDLAANPGWRLELARRARDRSERFSWDTVARDHRELYDAVLR